MATLFGIGNQTFRFPVPTMVYANPRQSHTILPHFVQRYSYSSPWVTTTGSAGRSLPVFTHLCFLSGLAGHMWSLPISPHAPPEMPSSCSSVRRHVLQPHGMLLSLRRTASKRVRRCWNSSEEFCRYSAGRGCQSLRHPFTEMRSCGTAQFG